MKKKTLILILPLLALPFLSYSQLSAYFNYNDVYIGKNTCIGIDFPINSKFHIKTGLKIHINDLRNDNEISAFRNRFYAESFLQNFGAELEFNYTLWEKEGFSRLYVFNTNQISYSQTRSTDDIYIGLFMGDSAYVFQEIITDKVLALEHYFGLGLEVELTNRLNIDVKAGYGIAHFYSGKVAILPKDKVRFDYMISFGLKYKFK